MQFDPNAPGFFKPRPYVTREEKSVEILFPLELLRGDGIYGSRLRPYAGFSRRPKSRINLMLLEEGSPRTYYWPLGERSFKRLGSSL